VALVKSGAKLVKHLVRSGMILVAGVLHRVERLDQQRGRVRRRVLERRRLPDCRTHLPPP